MKQLKDELIILLTKIKKRWQPAIILLQLLYKYDYIEIIDLIMLILKQEDKNINMKGFSKSLEKLDKLREKERLEREQENPDALLEGL